MGKQPEGGQRTTAKSGQKRQAGLEQKGKGSTKEQRPAKGTRRRAVERRPFKGLTAWWWAGDCDDVLFEWKVAEGAGCGRGRSEARDTAGKAEGEGGRQGG